MTQFIKTIRLPVQGMTCHSCVNAITKAITCLEGITFIRVDLDSTSATVTYDTLLISFQQLKDTIEDCGFDVPIKTMTLSNVTSSIHTAFDNTPAVIFVEISVENSNQASIVYDPLLIQSSEIVDILQDVGPNVISFGIDNTTISNTDIDTQTSSSRNTSEETVQLQVRGMTCASCVTAVENSLKAQLGVTTVRVALLAERVHVSYNPDTIDTKVLVEALGDAGFDASVMERANSLKLQIYGMTCASCVAAIERGLNGTRGIMKASVNLMTASATIEFNPEEIHARSIVQAIEELGFDATLMSTTKDAQLESLSKIREIQEWRTCFLKCVVFAVPVFFIAMILPMFQWSAAVQGVPFFIPGLFLLDAVQLLLTVPVQFGVGQRFLKSAWASVLHRAPTMDVLISVSTLTAFTFSIVSMVRNIFVRAEEPPPVFFDTCTMLITFVVLGRYLENKAKGKSSSALSKLMSLAPSSALLVTLEKDEIIIVSEQKIASDLIAEGDYLKLLPGEKVPTDGDVVIGNTTVDESMVTGEADTVPKGPGDALIGGTVNGLGTVVMKATRVGADTALSQIVKLVEDAQVNKAPIQGFVDSVAGYFVPTVISLGICTLVAWIIVVKALGIDQLPQLLQDEIKQKTNGEWLFVCVKIAISVIVIACPCAMGLATPTAVMVGTGVGAENGVLIKGGAVLENGQAVNKVVFDKTGTLTCGKLALVDSESWTSKFDAKALLVLAAIGESHSEHLLGRALVAAAKELTSLEVLDPLARVENFQSVPGFGISCDIVFGSKLPENLDLHMKSLLTPFIHTTQRVTIGNRPWLEEHHGISISREEEAIYRQQGALGRTCILLGIDGASSGYLSLSDVLKPEAKQVIATLHAMGLETAMVTGDNELTAKSIAAELGIHEVHAGVSPNGKTQIIRRMQEQTFSRKQRTWSLKRGYKSLSQDERTVVAMVGDGINDSPALVASDLGIALCSGTDIAMEAADVILMRNDLSDVVGALDLSKAIYRRIRMNLLWACIYNIVGIPLAMGIFLPWGYHIHPMMAGMAMAASSISVVLSSLMLRWCWRKPELKPLLDFDDNSPGYDANVRLSFLVNELVAENSEEDIEMAMKGYNSTENRNTWNRSSSSSQGKSLFSSVLSTAKQLLTKDRRKYKPISSVDTDF